MTAPYDLARTLAELLAEWRKTCRLTGLPYTDADAAAFVAEVYPFNDLASVVSRRDTDLRTRIETLARKHVVKRSSPYGVSVDTVTVDELMAALDGDTREEI